MLVVLRRKLAAQLAVVPAPLGFYPHGLGTGHRRGRLQHKRGLTRRVRRLNMAGIGAMRLHDTRTEPMNQPAKDLRQQIALFRYGVIADLLHLPLRVGRSDNG